MRIRENAYKMKSTDHVESCILMLQIGRQVAILCPVTDYRHKYAETICVAIHRQNVSMPEFCAFPDFMSYPLQIETSGVTNVYGLWSRYSLCSIFLLYRIDQKYMPTTLSLLPAKFNFTSVR